MIWFFELGFTLRGRYYYVHEVLFLVVWFGSQARWGYLAQGGTEWAWKVSELYLFLEGIALALYLCARVLSALEEREKKDQGVSRKVEAWIDKTEAALTSDRATKVYSTLGAIWQTLVDFKKKVCRPVQWVP